MSQTFTTEGRNQVIGFGFEDLEVKLVAATASEEIANAVATTGTVNYDFSSDSGPGTVLIPPTTIEGIPQNTTITRLLIKRNSDDALLWEQDGFSFVFSTTGTLTLDGTFSLGGFIANNTAAAILKYGLSERSGVLTLEGNNVQTSFESEAFAFGETPSAGGISQAGEVVFNIEGPPYPITISSLNVDVTFPAPAGSLQLGVIPRSPALVYNGIGTVTVSQLRAQLTEPS